MTTVLQLLTYKLSLEFFSSSGVRIHIRMAFSTRVSIFPGAAPNLSAISCHTEARAHRVDVVSDFTSDQSVFHGEAFSIWLNAEYVEVVRW